MRSFCGVEEAMYGVGFGSESGFGFVELEAFG